MTFPALVDSTGASSRLLGFKVVPNGILVDRDGIVRYRKDGGFSHENVADRTAVERFARGYDPGPSPESQSPYALGELERELVDVHLEYGNLLASLGRTTDAVREWRAALRLDPENKTIRTPIWAALHPERFHPTIDRAWQQQQFRREREAEIAAGTCGEDGCPLPSS